MRKIIFLILMLFVTTITAQVSKPDSINYEKDAMTDKEYVMFHESLLCSENGKSINITIKDELEKVVQTSATCQLTAYLLFSQRWRELFICFY